MEHFNTVANNLRSNNNYSFYELVIPTSVDIYVELYTRLAELPFVCQLILLLQNNGYTYMSADTDVDEVIFCRILTS